jgi:hypothetical protein
LIEIWELFPGPNMACVNAIYEMSPDIVKYEPRYR